LVTLSQVPRGRLRCAQVILFISKRSPPAVVRPWNFVPYHDATPVWYQRFGLALTFNLALLLGGAAPEAWGAVPAGLPSLPEALSAMLITRKPAANLRTDLCFSGFPVLKEVLVMATLHLLFSLPVQLKSIICKRL
jgi:hypothetical protein